ncbi:hypothetical protein [Crossiella sp. CA198]|uniref:hypothetical protein n=1 Tax=Crossiella sp. CA198 TaxID=3455607 RepID=UPI003F8D0B16
MRRAIGVFLLVVAIVAFIFALRPYGCAVLPRYIEVIYEDDPRFDCRTMGNRICGPGVK